MFVHAVNKAELMLFNSRMKLSITSVITGEEITPEIESGNLRSPKRDPRLTIYRRGKH